MPRLLSGREGGGWIVERRGRQDPGGLAGSAAAGHRGEAEPAGNKRSNGDEGAQSSSNCSLVGDGGDSDGRAGLEERCCSGRAGDEVRGPPGELLAFGVGLAENVKLDARRHERAQSGAPRWQQQQQKKKGNSTGGSSGARSREKHAGCERRGAALVGRFVISRRSRHSSLVALQRSKSAARGRRRGRTLPQSSRRNSAAADWLRPRLSITGRRSNPPSAPSASTPGTCSVQPYISLLTPSAALFGWILRHSPRDPWRTHACLSTLHLRADCPRSRYSRPPASSLPFASPTAKRALTFADFRSRHANI